jgi:hypothetical protein
LTSQWFLKVDESIIDPAYILNPEVAKAVASAPFVVVEVDDEVSVDLALQSA